MSGSVAVVICAHLWERAQQLKEAIDSVRRQTRSPEEIIVVLDGCPSLEAELRRAYAEITVIALPGPSGLATARNLGVAAATADTVLFLDDDAIAAPDWVELLAAAVEEEGILGASGCSLPIWGGRRPVWLADEFLWTVGCSYRGQPVARARVRNVYGGCCGLRRQIFTELEGYDARMGRSPSSAGGGEEAELCLRAQERWPEGSFIYEPSASIRHHVPVARLRAGYVLRRAYDEGKMKATVARLHRGGLLPERRFAAGLPLSILSGLGRALFGDLRAGGEAVGSMVLALAVLAGLFAGRLRQVRQPALPAPAASPEERLGVPVA